MSFNERMRAFDNAAIPQLEDRDWLVEQICHIGVLNDQRPLYHQYSQYQVPDGMLQNPDELARFLLYFRGIKSYLEIGVLNGTMWNTCTAYWRRFGLKYSYGIDPTKRLNFEVFPLYSEMTFYQDTSDKFSKKVDLVFIDGDHTYEWAMRDFNNIRAKYYAFHDVNDADVERLYKPSCADAYRELAARYYHAEIIYDKPAHEKSFGFGIIFKE